MTGELNKKLWKLVRKNKRYQMKCKFLIEYEVVSEQLYGRLNDIQTGYVCELKGHGLGNGCPYVNFSKDKIKMNFDKCENYKLKG